MITPDFYFCVEAMLKRLSRLSWRWELWVTELAAVSKVRFMRRQDLRRSKAYVLYEATSGHAAFRAREHGRRAGAPVPRLI